MKVSEHTIHMDRESNFIIKINDIADVSIITVSI